MRPLRRTLYRTTARRHPERATKARVRAALTRGKADLWKARLAVKTLCKDQREAIAEVGES